MDMDLKFKKVTYNLIFLLPIILLWIFVIIFISNEYSKEKEYKVKELDAQLQLLNRFILKDLEEKQWTDKRFQETSYRGEATNEKTVIGKNPVGEPAKDEAAAGNNPIEDIVDDITLPAGSVRITVISLMGEVLYDNMNRANSMENHKERKEVLDAINDGKGNIISRLSTTNGIKYFYSATRGERFIVRSALPYTVTLNKTLRANSKIIWIILGLTITITIVGFFLLRTVKQRDENYIKTLKQEQEQEDEKRRLKSQLTNNINHELKTPVASIQICLETLMNSNRLSEEQKEKIIKSGYQSCRRLTALLSDISLITRLESGKQYIQLEQVNVTEILNEIKDEFEILSGEKGISLNILFPDNVLLQGNSSLIISIFKNLIENSLAYSEGKNIKITLLENGENECKISFEDDGIGVSSKHLPYLFERFYRVDKGRSRQKGGTGLGLAIVKHAVLFHGGNIDVCNNPAGGLKFIITLKK